MASDDGFSHFLKLRKQDLQRIARATRGEHELNDVISEAWLLATQWSSTTCAWRMSNPR